MIIAKKVRRCQVSSHTGFFIVIFGIQDRHSDLHIDLSIIYAIFLLNHDDFDLISWLT